MNEQAGIVLVLGVYLGVLVLQQAMLWHLHKQIGTLVSCIDLLNQAIKCSVRPHTTEPTQEQIDRINAIVFTEIARQLYEDDDETTVH